MDYFISHCLICHRLLWKEQELCPLCLKQCQDLEVIYRSEKDLSIISLFSNYPSLFPLIRFWKTPQGHSLIRKLSLVLFQKAVWEFVETIDAIIPMPPRIKGDKDHAWQVGQVFSSLTGAPLLADCLARGEKKEDQKTKKLVERREIRLNLTKPLEVKDGVVILVDDIVTSGSTLMAAWTLLGKPQAFCATLAFYRHAISYRRLS